MKEMIKTQKWAVLFLVALLMISVGSLVVAQDDPEIAEGNVYVSKKTGTIYVVDKIVERNIGGVKTQTAVYERFVTGPRGNIQDHHQEALGLGVEVFGREVKVVDKNSNQFKLVNNYMKEQIKANTDSKTTQRFSNYQTKVTKVYGPIGVAAGQAAGAQPAGLQRQRAPQTPITSAQRKQASSDLASELKKPTLNPKRIEELADVLKDGDDQDQGIAQQAREIANRAKEKENLNTVFMKDSQKFLVKNAELNADENNRKKAATEQQINRNTQLVQKGIQKLKPGPRPAPKALAGAKDLKASALEQLQRATQEFFESDAAEDSPESDKLEDNIQALRKAALKINGVSQKDLDDAEDKGETIADIRIAAQELAEATKEFEETKSEEAKERLEDAKAGLDNLGRAAEEAGISEDEFDQESFEAAQRVGVKPRDQVVPPADKTSSRRALNSVTFADAKDSVFEAAADARRLALLAEEKPWDKEAARKAEEAQKALTDIQFTRDIGADVKETIDSGLKEGEKQFQLGEIARLNAQKGKLVRTKEDTSDVDERIKTATQKANQLGATDTNIKRATASGARLGSQQYVREALTSAAEGVSQDLTALKRYQEAIKSVEEFSSKEGLSEALIPFKTRDLTLRIQELETARENLEVIPKDLHKAEENALKKAQGEYVKSTEAFSGKLKDDDKNDDAELRGLVQREINSAGGRFNKAPDDTLDASTRRREAVAEATNNVREELRKFQDAVKTEKDPEEKKRFIERRDQLSSQLAAVETLSQLEQDRLELLREAEVDRKKDGEKVDLKEYLKDWDQADELKDVEEKVKKARTKVAVEKLKSEDREQEAKEAAEKGEEPEVKKTAEKVTTKEKEDAADKPSEEEEEPKVELPELPDGASLQINPGGAGAKAGAKLFLDLSAIGAFSKEKTKTVDFTHDEVTALQALREAANDGKSFSDARATLSDDEKKQIDAVQSKIRENIKSSRTEEERKQTQAQIDTARFQYNEKVSISGQLFDAVIEKSPDLENRVQRLREGSLSASEINELANDIKEKGIDVKDLGERADEALTDTLEALESHQKDKEDAEVEDESGEVMLGVADQTADYGSILLGRHELQHEIGSFLTSFQSRAAVSNALFGKSFLQDWIAEVDGFMASNYLGSDYWVSEICLKEFDVVGESVAFVIPPSGIPQLVATVNGERSNRVPMLCGVNPDTNETGFCQVGSCREGDQVCVDDKGDIINEFFYKLTYAVNAPGDEALTPYRDEEGDVAFNVFISGRDKSAFLYREPLQVFGGQQARDVLVKYSPFQYDRICLQFTKKPVGRDGQEIKQVCNIISQSPKSFINSATNPSQAAGARGSGPQYCSSCW